MAKGYDQHMDRKNIVTGFGKNLTRRSKATCELCEAREVKLHVYEVPPVKEEPDYDRCLFLCEQCIDKIERITKIKENDLRFLSNSVWSEVPLVKALSVYFLRKFKDYGWAEETLENAYLDEEILELIDSINFDKK